MNKVFKLVLTSVFAAMITVSVLIIHIPMPGGIGYINPADAFGITAGIFLGPIYGAIAAGIGNALSDLILGYTIYIPATFIIKALGAASAFYIFKALTKKKVFAYILSTVTAETIMVLGYFIYEYFILQYKEAAIPNVGFNVIQGIGSAIIAVLLITGLNKTRIIEKAGFKNE